MGQTSDKAACWLYEGCLPLITTPPTHPHHQPTHPRSFAMVGEDIKPPSPLLLLLLQLAVEEAAYTLCKILRGFMVRSGPCARPVSAAVVQPDKACDDITINRSLGINRDELHLPSLNYYEILTMTRKKYNKQLRPAYYLILYQQDWKRQM